MIAPVTQTPDVDEAEFARLMALRRDMSDEELAVRAASIRPLMRSDKGDTLRYVDVSGSNPRTRLYTVNPRYLEDAKNIVLLDTVPTLHMFNYRGIFKPTVYDVLQMIPDDLIARTVAFCVRGPRDIHDLNRQWAAMNAGFHVAITSLFRLG